MIKSIIFDFDGVLVESVDVKTEAFAAIGKPFGENAADKLIDYHIKNGGISRHDKFRYLYRDILKKPLVSEELEKLGDHFASLVVDKVVAAPYVEGAREFLERFHEQLELFLISGTPEEELREILDQRHMSGYFKQVAGSPKPKPETTIEFIEASGSALDETVFVGDALTDYRAARIAGIDFVGRVPKNETGQGIFTGLSVSIIQDLLELPTALGLD